jgi:copper(I)-binding protein
MTARLFLLLMLVLSPVAAAQTAAPPIEIANAWARATPGPTGAVYLTIKNAGSTDDRLEAASTPVADMVQPHAEIDAGGITRMLPLTALDAKANSDVTLKPGGIHLMLMGLHAPLREGERFPLTLVFGKAGNIGLTVAVGKAGAMEPPPQQGATP